MVIHAPVFIAIETEKRRYFHHGNISGKIFDIDFSNPKGHFGNVLKPTSKSSGQNYFW